MRGSRATAAREGRGPTTNLCCSRYLALGRALGSCAVDTTESTVMLLPTIAFITHAVVKNCLQCQTRPWSMGKAVGNLSAHHVQLDACRGSSLPQSGTCLLMPPLHACRSASIAIMPCQHNAAILCMLTCLPLHVFSSDVTCTFCKHCATKSWKVSDHLSRSAKRGGGSLEIMKMTRMGCTDHLGGVTSAISTALIPSAHTSTCSHAPLLPQACQ